MSDAEKLYNVLSRSGEMIKKRQQMYEELAKNSGAHGKRTNGLRARECSTILQEIYKIIKEYEDGQ